MSRSTTKSEDKSRTAENVADFQAPVDSTSELGANNSVGQSVNEKKKFFDMKIAGVTAVLSIYLTLIVREIIDKSLVAQGFGLPVDQYILILLLLLLVIQHYFGALGSLAQNHLFRVTNESKWERVKDLVFFQIDFIMQLVEFSLFYYTAHNICKTEIVSKGLFFIMLVNLVWSAFSYIAENECGRSADHTTRWVFKYLCLTIASAVLVWASSYPVIAKAGTPLLIAFSVAIEFYLNIDFHVMNAPKEYSQ